MTGTYHTAGEDEDAKQPLPGFKVVCESCGSDDVAYCRSVWDSPETGGDDASIRCRKCNQSCEIP